MTFSAYKLTAAVLSACSFLADYSGSSPFAVLKQMRREADFFVYRWTTAEPNLN
jgi:hypothetical protein